VTNKSAFLIAAAGAALLAGGPAGAHDPGLARCLAIADREARLTCYDAIARAEQSAPAPDDVAPPAPATAPVPAAPARAAPAPTAVPNPRAEFGFGAAEREERRAVDQRQIDEINVAVKEAREVGAGYWQFVMDDGSTWRLAETRTSYRIPRPGDQVKLRRASLGSYLLVFRNQPSLRIRRVQ
jgi:hypothetical protein